MNFGKFARGYVRRSAQNGQAIILIAFAMIALLAALGLAIDGGGTFLLYRDAYNAVDAGTRAGSYSSCANGDMTQVTYAVQAAIEDNEFYIGSPRVRDFSVTAPVSWMPDDSINHRFLVSMTAIKPTYFIYLLGWKEIPVTVTAIGHCTDEHISASDAGIAALSTTCQNAFNLSGNDANIQSNIASGESIKSTLSSGLITGEGWYGLTYEGTANTIWDPSVNNPAQTSLVIYDDMPWTVEQFQPGGVYYEMAAADGMLTVINDGSFVANNRLLEGLYVLTGQNGDFRGVGQGNRVGAKGLTVVTTNGGAITLSGNNLNFHPYIPGLFLFSTAVTNCGTPGISFSSANAEWSGDLYCPQCRITIDDRHNSSFDSRIVGDTVDIHSSSTTIINPVGTAHILPAHDMNPT